MTTEVEAAAALAAVPHTVDNTGEDVVTIVAPPSWRITMIDTEPWRPTPNRPRGTVQVYDAESFARVVHDRVREDVHVYADEASFQVTAILNDDDGSGAGWRDYRVDLFLRPTVEWSEWRGSDGSMMSQVAFAEHIENHLTDLTDPPSADLLEIAQTFHARTSAKFKGGHRLASGAVQFVYEEDVDATAGKDGSVSIPSRLTLVVAPFYGGNRYEVGAWFRYRLSRETLTLGYKLDRPIDVERAAFNAVLADIRERMPGAMVIAGPPPPTTDARSTAIPAVTPTP